MLVLIADKFEKSGVDGLKALGCDVKYEPDLVDDALAATLAASKADVLVVRSTKVTEAMIAPTLKLIVRAGAGVNTIDVKAATARGTIVANCPGKNSIAVAELAFGLLLAVDRRIPENVADLRAGVWNKKEYSKARGVFGATLGLLGAGNIAREMVVRAAAFGMPVVLWSRRFDGQDRAMTESEAREWGVADALRQTSIRLAPTPIAATAHADVLSIHVPLGARTKQMVNAEILKALKPGAVVINTSRGDVMDYEALRDAIRERKLRVALDVFADEPAAATGAFVDPIVKEPGVYGTHHIGASTDQAQEAIAAETVRIVKQFKETGVAPNAVN
jgi:D-3-phosphoglycerate dehydrogenase